MKRQALPKRAPKKNAGAARKLATADRSLSVIPGGLPAEFPATIAIVMHLASNHKSVLAEILSRRTPLRVKQAQTGDQPGGRVAA